MCDSVCTNACSTSGWCDVSAKTCSCDSGWSGGDCATCDVCNTVAKYLFGSLAICLLVTCALPILVVSVSIGLCVYCCRRRGHHHHHHTVVVPGQPYQPYQPMP
eukprot:TRINITY_DN14606_c0_g1_i1.p1 TRINITY_DN14606_c0_g1~~TRINITY_DN14606_c0_g1_i1.p1  ORF type:complete len:104 (+),score=2.90 TRINITY_DN14606_c0_g1_i1:27-338(+)